MYKINKSGVSKEEKVAANIGKLLTDFTLDLEAIGLYLSHSPLVIYSRVIEVLESTEHNKTVSEYRNRGKYYSDNLKA